jgi:hypothetical protein
MDGNLHIPDSSLSKTYVFTSTNAVYRTWTKPPGISFVHIIAIGGGGGGAGGGRWSAGTARIGGGGGGSAGFSVVCFPSILVPDTLYIRVGAGGAGGAGSTTLNSAGTGGSTAQPTYVAFYPAITAPYVLVTATAGSGGLLGGGSGPAGAIATAANMPISHTGMRTLYTGVGGGTSNTSADIALFGVTNAARFYSGAAGAGISTTTAFAGGAQNGVFEYISRTIPGGANTGQPGTNGVYDLTRFVFSGGAGGGASTVTAGGAGGKGGIGSGGGGGAAGSTVGGRGGDGGDGLVIITCG